MSESASNLPQVRSAFLRPSPSVVVSDNERKVLDLVRRNKEISRANLTRSTGLTAQSVSRIVEGLVSRRFLNMGKAIATGRGQPSPPVSLNPNAAYSIGISIMTDAVSAALMNFCGNVVDQRAANLPASDLESVLVTIESLIKELTDANVRNPERVFGVGVGVTGYFIGEGKKVNPPDPLGELAFVDLDKIISERLDLPVWIDNDGNVAAVGESLAGRGLEFDTFAYIYFSKGIGGSLVVDRRMYGGAFGNAGEFAGILPASVQSDRPTLELLRKILCAHGTELKDLNELIESFNPNWPGVDEWINRVRPHLESITAAIAAVFDPQVIVLGGRMPPALAERLSKELQFESVARRGYEKPVPKLIASGVSGDATAIGAAAAPLKAHFFI